MDDTYIGKFHTTDYIVFAIRLGISAGIGVYFKCIKGKHKTSSEDLLHNLNIKIVPVAFSLMGCFMSVITVLGMSAEFYSYGTLFLVINFSNIIFAPVAAYLYLPVFFKLKATSVYEYLEKRFGIRVRITAFLIYILYITLYIGIVLYAAALALETVTGLSQNMSIIVVGLFCICYSTIGGIKEVTITDVLQSVLMFVAVFIIIFGVVYKKGSFFAIWNIAKERERIQFFNIDSDPTVRHTYWSLLFGGGLTYLSFFAINQTQVQRYISMKDYNTAIKSLWLSLLIMLLLSLSTAFFGLAIFYRFYNCDPLLTGRISSSDQLLPLFIAETVGHIPGFAGMFISGIFSAAMNTVSACFNSLAAATLEDYIKPLYLRYSNKTISDSKSGVLSKLLALGFGFMCFGIAFHVHIFGGLLQAVMTIFGVLGGPMLGVFTLGMFIPSANETGTLVGVLSGLSFSILLGFGGPKPPTHKLPLSTAGCYSNTTTTIATLTAATITDTSHYSYLFRISYMYYIVLGFIVTMVVGVIISWIATACGGGQEKSHPDFFSPPVAKFLRRHRGKMNIELVDEINSSHKH